MSQRFYCDGRDSDAIIAPNVTTITRRAYKGYRSITKIILPESVETIENSAFCGCESLSKFVMPSVIRIGEFAFSYCAFSTITLPETIKSIDYTAFYGCENLISIEVPRTLAFVVIRENMEAESFGIDMFIKINDHLGKLSEVFLKKSFSRIPQWLFLSLDLGNEKDNGELIDEDGDRIYVNWRICAHQENRQGRLPLFTTLGQAVDGGSHSQKFGVRRILEANPAAIEKPDVVTGLEAFMLAAIGGGRNRLQTVYRLLQYHPGAIISYVKSMPHDNSYKN